MSKNVKKIPTIKVIDSKPYDLLDDEKLDYDREKPSFITKKLFVTDIQALICPILCNQDYRMWPRFCRFSRSQLISAINIIVVEGYSESSLVNLSNNDNEILSDKMKQLKSLLSEQAEFIDSISYGIHWQTELFQIPGYFMSDFIRLSNDLSLNFKDVKEKIGENCKRKLCDMKKTSYRNFNVLRSVLKLNGVDTNKKSIINYEQEVDVFSRKKLLMNLRTKISERIPMYDPDIESDFCHLRDPKEYLETSDASPLFALDCEMVDCMAPDSSKPVKSLAAITIINEYRQVIYKSFVKPSLKITNYLTKYSGVTKKSLQDVTTTLADVQNSMRDLLPLDAILVGHSIANDLEALKIFYPYLIDTSCIYNLNNSKHKKDKLKILARLFLNRKIQSNDKGHDSEEDAMATMDLVKLKLTHGIDFGIVSKKYVNDAFGEFVDVDDDKDDKEEAEKEESTEEVNKNEESIANSTEEEEEPDFYPIVTTDKIDLRHRQNLEKLISSSGSIHLIDYYLNCIDCVNCLQNKQSDLNEMLGNHDDMTTNTGADDMWIHKWFPESMKEFLKKQQVLIEEKQKLSAPIRHKEYINKHPFNITIIDNKELPINQLPSQNWLLKFYEKVLEEWNDLPDNSLTILMTINSRYGHISNGYIDFGIKINSESDE